MSYWAIRQTPERPEITHTSRAARPVTAFAWGKMESDAELLSFLGVNIFNERLLKGQVIWA
jgi:hypothetical protein